jgi:hypothetical protein
MESKKVLEMPLDDGDNRQAVDSGCRSDCRILKIVDGSRLGFAKLKLFHVILVTTRTVVVSIR